MNNLVKYNNNSYYLNERLIKQQFLSSEEVDKLVSLHIEKLKVFEKMNATEDKNELIDLANSVSDLEYQMQYVWGFNLDSKVHDWFNVPKCTCPKSDNKERKGTKYKIHNQKCLIHGS